VLRVKLERLSRGVNQTAIGKLTRIPQAVLSQIENGHLKPSPARLRRLSAFYRVPADELLREVALVGAQS
jgi:transcriptional regulator with XRE-family HTH domain